MKNLSKIFLLLVGLICSISLVGCDFEKSSNQNNNGNLNQNEFLTTGEQVSKVIENSTNDITNMIIELNSTNAFSEENIEIANKLTDVFNSSLFSLSVANNIADTKLFEVYGYEGNYVYFETENISSNLKFYLICSDNENFKFDCYRFDINYDENLNIEVIDFKYLSTDDEVENKSILIANMYFNAKNKQFSAFSGKPLNISAYSNYNYLIGYLNEENFRKIKWEYSLEAEINFLQEYHTCNYFSNPETNSVVSSKFVDNILMFDVQKCYEIEAVCNASFENDNLIENNNLLNASKKAYVEFDENLTKFVVLVEVVYKEANDA